MGRRGVHVHCHNALRTVACVALQGVCPSGILQGSALRSESGRTFRPGEGAKEPAEFLMDCNLPPQLAVCLLGEGVSWT